MRSPSGVRSKDAGTLTPDHQPGRLSLFMARRSSWSRPVRSRHHTHRSLATLIVVVSLVLAGCTSRGPGTDEPKAGDPDRAAADFAKALSNEDLSGLTLSGIPAAEANQQLKTKTAGLGSVKPGVAVTGVVTKEDRGTAQLHLSWPLPGAAKPWTYDSTLTLVHEDGDWQASWRPSTLHPDLDAAHRLVQHRTPAKRGETVGAGDKPIVTLRDVWRVGIDKTKVDADHATGSATALAKLLDLDPKSYAAEVKAAGPQAFVEALSIRDGSADLPSEQKLGRIAGAVKIGAQAMLAPTREFARPILGVVGEASKEVVDKSDGQLMAGDQVGLSGLQQRYDAQLRGKPGITVTLAPDTSASTASPSPSRSASASPSASSATGGPKVLFSSPAVDGKPLAITLNVQLQQVAERVVSATDPTSALVAIKPSTGAVLAAATGGKQSDGQSAATIGRYPPGSTFKVASSLALLRSGLTPSSKVPCPATVTVDGRKFTNYSDYPASSLGTITLRTAVAQSCNTAFISERDELRGSDLAEAAASLGLGTDYDVGFPAFFGAVPPASTETGRAAAMIGQGTVEASPLAMAAVAASVAKGATVVPHLVDNAAAKPRAKPLTSTEAGQLRELMRAVVSEGSGRFLASLGGPDIIAKTGTAEYGPKTPPKTHAWMIAAQGDLAVAVFVADGDSGSTTAGPLLKKFLQQAR